MSTSAPCFRGYRPRLVAASAAHHAPIDGPELTGPVPLHAGLEDAFRSERSSLLRYLGRRAGPDAAHDLVQEVFVRAAGSEQASRLANPAAFVRRIARNLLIDRSRRRQTDVTVFPLDENRDIASPPEQMLELEAADLRRIYEDAVRSLPEKTRCVFLLSRDDELTYGQIGERLGITVATVQYHMVRAIAIVAAAVKDHR
ncbi:RNA polymerase sigma factor [Novosphingobium sp. P6W]|uniref:RNA polymerase sigma factor n=1 Tax=Novosphingobium sp. P6W TaxID=1609758 RepID=UPI0009E43E01|nr:RNA polymerase sigma factor [Novosphingobium sp. P6W]AXB76568.1 RNA polymerase sigma factor [Novosphingobium sp. P6W]